MKHLKKISGYAFKVIKLFLLIDSIKKLGTKTKTTSELFAMKTRGIKATSEAKKLQV